MTRADLISRVEQLKNKVSELDSLTRSGAPSTPANTNTDISAASGGVQAREAGPTARGTSNPQSFQRHTIEPWMQVATQPAAKVKPNPRPNLAHRVQLPLSTSIPQSAP
ncbi:hypothetical protein JCM24511_05265 [Saitozyma sp. JCM 24511]|nr:hypothetical protein JCM24511_05265 [Saitozyma sp. JCM 24511]